MKDFEVHKFGTAEEIRLSRALASAIDQIIIQYGEGIIPIALLRPYRDLERHYDKSIEEEKHQNCI